MKYSWKLEYQTNEQTNYETNNIINGKQTNKNAEMVINERRRNDWINFSN